MAAVIVFIVSDGKVKVANAKILSLEQKLFAAEMKEPTEKRVEVPVERVVEVPVEKEVIKYVDRIVEKRIEVPMEKIVEVPVEKEVVRYVDRIVEKEVEKLIEPSPEEKERLVSEGRREAESIIREAQAEAENIRTSAREEAEKEGVEIRRKAELQARQTELTARLEIKEQKAEIEKGLQGIRNREEVLEKWKAEIAEIERKTAYNHTRSETHRKESLKLKHEAKEIRDDMLKQGSEYLAELRDRIGRLMETTRIEDESVLDAVSKELAEKRKEHRQRMKKEARLFADANFHELDYDSRKICLMAVSYCDLLADKLIGNIHRTGAVNALEKVREAIEATEALFPPSVGFKISDAYIEAKKEQIQLACEIETYKLEQKELRRKRLEAEREERRAQKELEAERKKAEEDEMQAQAAIERNRFEMANAKTQAEMDKYLERIARLEEALRQAQERRERALSMAQQTKCGYVYVISNIGSFGEGVYKIGMTRRVEPMERVVELGDASVPFPFDVHAMIYTEDAPALEASLHRTFDDRKVNSVNGRKEFFRVSLDEVKEQVEKFGIECDWVERPSASQYRDSVRRMA